MYQLLSDEETPRLFITASATMKALLVGSTGDQGIRPRRSAPHTLPQLFLRCPVSNKLESLLPMSVYRQITVVQGDATDPL